MYKITITIFLSFICFNASANDSIFYGVWGSHQPAFKHTIGNIMITPDKIYWMRKGLQWRHDIEGYYCSTNYTIDERYKKKTYPGIPATQATTRYGKDIIYTVARFKLTSIDCEIEHYGKNIKYFMLATPSWNLGGSGILIEYDADERRIGKSSIEKINHLSD